MGLYLENKVIRHTSAYDLDEVEILGRDGVVLIDNKRTKPVQQPFPFYYKGDWREVQSMLRINWLTSKGWHNLFFEWENNSVYRATIIESVKFEELSRNFGRVEIEFLIHPVEYIYLSTGLKTIHNGQKLVNRGNVLAYPLVELTGQGDGFISINGRKTNLESVQGNLIIDTRQQRNLVISNGLAAWNSILSSSDSLPYLDLGENKIELSENFTAKIATWEGVKL